MRVKMPKFKTEVWKSDDADRYKNLTVKIAWIFSIGIMLNLVSALFTNNGFLTMMNLLFITVLIIINGSYKKHKKEENESKREEIKLNDTK